MLELESIDEKIDKLKKEMREKAAKILNDKYAGKYLTIDWVEGGFISMKVDRVNPGFDGDVEVEGFIVGNLGISQDWTEYVLGVTESYYIDMYNLEHDAKEITEEQFIEDCRGALEYLSDTIEEFIND